MYFSPWLRAAFRVMSALALLPAAPLSALSQTEVTVLTGVHFDRVDRPDRHLDHPTGGQMVSSSGEAPAIGLRLTHWLRPRVALEGEVALSRNRSWHGSSPFPRPDFHTEKVFTSVRLAIRTSSTDRVQLDLGAGPAFVFHGGTGESYLDRDVNVGAVLALGARIRFDDRLAVRLSGLGIYYGSRYTQPYQEVDGSVLGAARWSRRTAVVLAGLSYTFRCCSRWARVREAASPRR